jgi:protein TonB
MFESVKQHSQQSGMVYVTSLMVSFSVHVIVICLLILVPLIFFNGLQAEDLVTFLLEPPAPPAAPPPPSPPVKAGHAARPVQLQEGVFAPEKIPEGIPAPDTDFDPVDPGSIVALVPGAPVSGVHWGTGTRFEPIGISALPVLPPPPPPKPTRSPIRVGALEQSKLILKVNPVYPPLAIKAHVTGTVVLEAAIDEEGSVSAVQVLSGHVLLVDAAVQAVKQWKYSPTVLNGEPVPVIATVTVVFRLD